MDPAEAKDRGVDLAQDYLERLTEMWERVGSTGDPAAAFDPLCEIGHGIESPDPIQMEDYKRLSPFAGFMVGAMQEIREGRL